jgi:hypothetical protein
MNEPPNHLKNFLEVNETMKQCIFLIIIVVINIQILMITIMIKKSQALFHPVISSIHLYNFLTVATFRVSSPWSNPSSLLCPFLSFRRLSIKTFPWSERQTAFYICIEKLFVVFFFFLNVKKINDLI